MRQIRLDRKAGSATIDLSCFFYPLHLVQLTAREFKGSAKVSVKEEKGRVLVEIKPFGKEDPEEVALYFCNFALGLKRELGEHA